ncbi:aminotransferase class I/II-fold pyridoxal phosphate-dependent enzyme [Tumebacillus sp. ITR2]|uniref:Aminotransferase class I/II-fold pyridoxal phosphate-dependent enzyme n=1 Tax=Tumebacillus amylolyticus TaxID=2801339 RepID=A0ABS1JBV1_9BACL|nr:aminotransferase class I/II-fold pyridoxal phosphate-dependent enzyme [Tumebacillus amylolyticus]MBL0387752.1 aminotransferase class I/II-fold pyridoxal phosphate-dependent enzyme [Tumebacillus amylolyticus]
MTHLETKFAQIGNRRDPQTGSVSSPIYLSTTYSHPQLGVSTGFDYTRTKNPTRQTLEDAIAELEGGVRGFAYASGMAAIAGVFGLFAQGDHLIVSHDLYGGTYRLIEQILPKQGISATFVDTGDVQAVEQALQPNTKGIFVETPTNPTMRITDLSAIIEVAKRHNVLTIVDNTFMTPYLQRPLTLGADIVVHSATKYLGGHNDVLAGLVVARETEVGDKIYFLQNSIGATLGPQDCWLLMRGIKTLALRMDRHQENALLVAEWLAEHPAISTVYFPGLFGHVGRDIHLSQAAGYGGMLSFEVESEALVEPLLRHLKLITFAESLGGVESLITYPARQTHFDIPEEIRISVGVTNSLLRLSVGIEHHSDLIDDLAQALAAAEKEIGVKGVQASHE